MFSYLNHFGFDRLNIKFKEERNFIRFYHNCFYFVLDLPCVTEHSSFHAVCLNREVFWTALSVTTEKVLAFQTDNKCLTGTV